MNDFYYYSIKNIYSHKAWTELVEVAQKLNLKSDNLEALVSYLYRPFKSNVLQLVIYEFSCLYYNSINNTT